MTPQELQYWTLAQRRAQSLSPQIAAAILRAFQILRDQLPEAQLARLVAKGDVEALINLAMSPQIMDAAMQPVRDRIRTGVAQAAIYYAKQIPKAAAVAETKGQSVKFAFDILNPRVITGIRSLETKVVATLADDAKETVRAIVENGLRDGVGPSTIARDIRSVIGLAPSQEQIVRNFEAALRGQEGRNPLTYKLRDARFDRTLAKLKESGKPLSEEQIQKMTAAYRRKFVANNAETVAKTAAGDAMKLGQRLSVMDAIDKGIYDKDRLKHMWIGVADDRERASHVAMNNEVQPWDQAYSNGDMVPGQNSYNCRCIDRWFQSR